MIRFVSSPRRRRRVVWTAAGVVVAAAAAAAIASLPTGTPLPPPKDRLPAEPPVRDEREVPLTRAMRRSINVTLDRFVPAAVGRQDPALAWRIAGPGLRTGTTRRDWIAGNLPVHPFPFRKEPFHGWTPLFTYRDRVGLDLRLQPRAGARVGAIAFSVNVVRHRGRWLVDYWYPAAIWAPPDDGPFVTGAPDFTSSGTTAKAVYNAPKITSSTLSAAWLALPLGLLGSIVLVPSAFVIVAVRRNRRAAAAHAAFTVDRSSDSAASRSGERGRRQRPAL